MQSSLSLCGRTPYRHPSELLKLVIVSVANNRLCCLLVSPLFHDSTRAATLGACISAPPFGLTASEPAASFPTRMKCIHRSVLILVHWHVSNSNCAIYLPETEVEFHDYREVCTVDDAPVVDRLQMDCGEESSAPNSSNMDTPWYLLISLADESCLCTSALR